MVHLSENPKITCRCNACELTLSDPTPKMSVLCACEDCRQALSWAAKFGGKKPSGLVHNVYLRCDLSEIVGREHMQATQLRDDARSTRIFCRHCYACIGIDHVRYMNRVFMVQPDHCSLNFELAVKPTAVLFLSDYRGSDAPVPTDDTPIFHSFEDPQDYARYRAIPVVAETFSGPLGPPTGHTMSDLIESLKPVDNLGLTRGAPP